MTSYKFTARTYAAFEEQLPFAMYAYGLDKADFYFSRTGKTEWVIAVKGAAEFEVFKRLHNFIERVSDLLAQQALRKRADRDMAFAKTAGELHDQYLTVRGHKHPAEALQAMREGFNRGTPLVEGNLQINAIPRGAAFVKTEDTYVSDNGKVRVIRNTKGQIVIELESGGGEISDEEVNSLLERAGVKPAPDIKAYPIATEALEQGVIDPTKPITQEQAESILADFRKAHPDLLNTAQEFWDVVNTHNRRLAEAEAKVELPRTSLSATVQKLKAIDPEARWGRDPFGLWVRFKGTTHANYNAVGLKAKMEQLIEDNS